MRLDTMKATERYKEAETRLFKHNLTQFPTHKGELLKISDEYNGIWLEHSYDALLFATLYPEKQNVALSQARCFLENCSPDGRLPALVWDTSVPVNKGKHSAKYGQIQECVAFGRICLQTYRLTGDRTFLAECYQALCRWDAWLCANRMTQQTGLIELFCLYDTGHDNALRLGDISNDTPDRLGVTYGENPVLPLLAPDMNAVFYGDRMALSEMASLLDDTVAAERWKGKALSVQKKMFDLLYDKNDDFFYDRDKSGHLRKYKTVMMTTVFAEHLLDGERFDAIYNRYFKNQKEFYTPVLYPATAISDPHWCKNRSGNSWNYYAQTLVALRTDFWMEHYGKTTDYEDLLYRFLCLFTESSLPFGQEFDPITGTPSDCSPYYSSAMLFYINAMRKLGFMPH